MSAKRAILLTMAKMALADGKVAEQERGFLEPLLDENDTVDGLLEEAKGKEVSELTAGIDRYADRFFVALRAASMAMIDEELDLKEEKLYQELVETLEISVDDQQLIQRSVDDLNAVNPQPIDPRIEALFQQSSLL